MINNKKNIEGDEAPIQNASSIEFLLIKLLGLMKKFKFLLA
jgi:hypothetical protein